MNTHIASAISIRSIVSRSATLMVLLMSIRNRFDPSDRGVLAAQIAQIALLCGLMLFASTTVIAAPDSLSASGAEPTTPVEPLRVDVEPSIADAGLYQGWVRERNPGISTRFPDAPGHEQWISVSIAGATYDYNVTITAMRDGKGVGVVKNVPCECNSEALLESIDKGIAEAMDELRAESIEAAVAGETETEIAEAEEGGGTAETEHSQTEDDRPRSIGPLGYVGIGVGVLGAGALAAGIPLIFRAPDKVRGEPPMLEERSTKIPGIAMAIGGGVALAAGVTLVVVDVVRHRKRRVAVMPALGPHFTGASVDLRF